MLVEVCANSLESALNAQKAGADRIEICSELGVGGITPSYGLLKSIQEQIHIPVHVLIRPRSGDFTYSDTEFSIMKEDIMQCKAFGFQGIVSGILNVDSTLDVQRTSELVALSYPLKFTFHRAFDWLVDPFLALTQLENMGVHFILTSGQTASAINGLDLLTELQGKADKTIIMPGSGINETNAAIFKAKGFKAIHLSGTTFYPSSHVAPPLSMNSEAHLKEDRIAVTSIEIIRRVVHSVK